MLIKTIQWNIGGGKIRKSGDDPMDPLVYCNDNLDVIIETLKKYDPDIVTIQECHTNSAKCQAEIIAKALDLKYFVNDVYDKSHLEDGQGLSQCTLSRFPIENHAFTFFVNPKFEAVGLNGDHWISHDKGVTSCNVKLGEKLNLQIKNSHSIPCRRFNVDPLSEDLVLLRNDMAEKLKPQSNLYLYQGDLNFDNSSIKAFLPGLLTNETQEVILGAPTTPKGRKYDHILFRHLNHIKSEVISDQLTDHFPVYSEFNLT